MTNITRLIGHLCLMALFVASFTGNAAEDSILEEIRALLRSNLPQLSSTQLNQTTVEGLMKSLQGQVFWDATNDPATNPTALAETVVSKGAVFDGVCAYLRIENVGTDARATLLKRYEDLARSNNLKGLVLDLRNAQGQDIKQAADMVAAFYSEEQNLMSWKNVVYKSQKAAAHIPGPVAVLVNKHTSGAAEITAALLKHSRLALVVGSKTAGKTTEFNRHKLSNGTNLCIVTAAVIPAGSKPLPPDGINPDVLVKVSDEAETQYLKDPYGTAGSGSSATATSGTSRGTRSKLNEAELVRLKRQGIDLDMELPATVERSYEPPLKEIRDPALARCLDFIKGMHLIKSSKTL